MAFIATVEWTDKGKKRSRDFTVDELISSRGYPPRAVRASFTTECLLFQNANFSGKNITLRFVNRGETPATDTETFIAGPVEINGFAATICPAQITLHAIPQEKRDAE